MTQILWAAQGRFMHNRKTVGNTSTVTFILCAWLVSGVAQGCLAAEAPDAKAIQGTWTPVKAELAGRPWSDEVLKTITLKLRNGQYDVSVAGQLDRGTYAIDTSTTPKSLTITGTDGPNKGKTFLAIYELQGDTFRVCYDLSGKQRPTEFKTIAETELYLVTYNRAKQ